MNDPHPRVGYGQGWEDGRIVPVTWHSSYGPARIQLSAGVARRDRLRLALIALIYDRMVPQVDHVARKMKSPRRQTPATSKHNSSREDDTTA